MAIDISESTLTKTLEYLTDRAGNGDRLAVELLALFEVPALNLKVLTPIPNFNKRLFNAWQELVELQIGQMGENCWSYPVPFADIAENLSVSVETLIQHLETTDIHSLQLLTGRSTNYLVKSQQVGDLAFHSDPNSKSPKSSSDDPSDRASARVILKVGDRIRVNANRPQYKDQTGTIEQVISVSCKIKLDNGWIAFLPNHCLEKIT